MEGMTRDALILIALELELPDLLHFCQTQNKINLSVCENDLFWSAKLVRDFNYKESKRVTPIGPKREYKRLYNNKIRDQIRMVRNDGENIQKIENPIERVQLAAVQYNWYPIRYIRNPTEKVQLSAIEKDTDGQVLRYIQNPTEAVKLSAVRKNGKSIKYIKDPSYRLQKIAVTNNPWAIRYIPNPSEELKKLAVNAADGSAIRFIENPSEELQMLSAARKKKLTGHY